MTLYQLNALHAGEKDAAAVLVNLWMWVLKEC
jgi:hypothetical protein